MSKSPLESFVWVDLKENPADSSQEVLWNMFSFLSMILWLNLSFFKNLAYYFFSALLPNISWFGVESSVFIIIWCNIFDLFASKGTLKVEIFLLLEQTCLPIKRALKKKIKCFSRSRHCAKCSKQQSKPCCLLFLDWLIVPLLYDYERVLQSLTWISVFEILKMHFHFFESFFLFVG